MTQVPSSTRWFVRLTSPDPLPDGADVADLLGSFGVWVQQTSSTEGRHGAGTRWLLTYACTRQRIECAVGAVLAASNGSAFVIRALEASRE